MAARRKARREAKRKTKSAVPGMGNMSNKQMKRAMDQMDVQDIADVQEVIIRTSTEEIVLKDSEVQVMNMSGQEIYTITAGSTETRGLKEEVITHEEIDDTTIELKDSDIQLVMKQTGKDKETVIQALHKSKGDLASAILSLK